MADYNKFWAKISKSLGKKSALKGDCVEFTGFIDKYGYGVKKVTWPNGSLHRDGAHRVAFMLEHRILRWDVPRLDVYGFNMDVSHLCHNKKCIKPSHLVLESHLTNLSRCHCVSTQSCTGHEPPCFFGRTS